MSEEITRTLSNGQKIEFSYYRGTVISSRESESVSIHQGNTVVNGNILPGRISSSISSIHKVWLKAADGTEKSFDFSDMGVDLREGHELLVIDGSSVKSDRLCTVIVYNFMTKTVEYRAPIGGVNSSNNDLARRVWKPRAGLKLEALKIYGVCAGFVAFKSFDTSYYDRGFSFAIMMGLFVGLPLALVVWLIAVVSKLSPARRRELAIYAEISSATDSVLNEFVGK